MKTHINSQLIRDYARFKASGAGIVGESALWAFRDAKTLEQWREREAAGQLRIVAEPEEESYFDSYGTPDDPKERAALERTLEHDGVWWVATEYFDGNDWQCADSIGMCAGYKDPCSPFENCYVPQLMRAALEKLESEWMADQSGEHDENVAPAEV